MHIMNYKKVFLLFLFGSVMFNAYGQPTFNEAELNVLLFGVVLLVLSIILFIISVISWILLGLKKYYKGLFWTSSFLVLFSIFIIQQSKANGPTTLYFRPIGAVILLTCTLNLLIGNRSLFSSSDKFISDRKDKREES